VGAASSALSPCIQMRLMEVAGESQTIAAAVNHSSLNLGNSLGAYLGGVVIAAGYGYLAPTWVGLALCVPAVILVVVSLMLGIHQRRAADAQSVTHNDSDGSGDDSEGAGGLRLEQDAVLDGSLS